MGNYFYPEGRIAVVGIGGVFPEAGDMGQFWNNIIEKRVSIKRIPDDVVNSEIYYRPEYLGQIDKKDKSYTQCAGILDHKLFLDISRKFKIPPAVSEHMDENQLAAVYCVDQALGQMGDKKLPRERTAVILGNGMPGLKHGHILKRTNFQQIEHHLRKNVLLRDRFSSEQIDKLIMEIGGAFLEETIPVTEDSAPGILPNLVAGRIANVFDFWGPSFTVDAACASALAAVASGMEGLQKGEFDAVITGAADIPIAPLGMVIFSAINALSPDGSYPFDIRANGFVMGAGAGVVILKRLEDAICDKDRILAVLSGYGRGSDGKGKYIAAPNEEGQVRVIENACKMAGYSVDTIEMVEAHGTGTTVGDVVEVNALKKAFQSLGATRREYCGVGSVKSNIGHLKSAAGAPGMLKTILALQNKILPATASIQQVNPKLNLEGSPFYVMSENRSWLENPSHPRRGNVSAFGFGGADYHILFEEFRDEFVKKQYHIPFGKPQEQAPAKDASPEKGVLLFSGGTMEDLKASVEAFMDKCTSSSDFAKAARLNNQKSRYDHQYRLAIQADSINELAQRWKAFLGMQNPEGMLPPGISYGAGAGIKPENTAILFPGQASQYPNMLRELYHSHPIFRAAYDTADLFWENEHGEKVSSFVFGDDSEAIDKKIKETQYTHPAIFTSSYAMYKMLENQGLRAEVMIGHSLGEITALAASDALPFSDALRLVSERGHAFLAVPEGMRGRLVSIKAPSEQVESILAESGAAVQIANANSSSQTVVGGTREEVDKLLSKLRDNKLEYTLLNVSHAFHTPLIKAAGDLLLERIAGIQYKKPKVRVMANHRVAFYPQAMESAEFAQTLSDQVNSPVRFQEAVKKLYDEGVRLFVEVGPGAVLSGLVREILGDKDVMVLSSNLKKKSAIACVNQLIGDLFAVGMPVQVPVFETAAMAPEVVILKKEGRQESLVYSGVSLGLPGTFKPIFSDENYELLFQGRNLIEKLTDEERQRMVDLNITRLVKSEESAAFKDLSSLNEVIQLAGKLGDLDIPKDYLVDEDLMKQMTKTVAMAVGAGYEALADAGIPLVRETRATSTGARIEGRLLLPEEMRKDTGVIFANGFPMVEPFIQEVSRFVAYKYGRKARMEMIDFYSGIISAVSDENTKKLLSDWFALNYSRLADGTGVEDVYKFNNHFMSQIASQANNRLAQFIGAEGPNFQLNAACSSTAYAITLAEDMIRAGHARRMIIIGADDPSSRESLSWLGAGFLCAGAATNSGNLYEAALPFDNRRSGMLIGAGAVGVVIEKEEDVKARGMHGLCRILGSHAFNMAGHQTRIDSGKFSQELEHFIGRIEKEYGITRESLASQLVYFAHETYTPKEGGCSQTEKVSLERVFRNRFKEILVCNTKGMTGHTMGASIEEAAAAKALQYQKVPPVVNYKVPDPELEGLRLSKGGSHSFEYVLRMVAGFGGQGNYNLLQRIALGENRMADRGRYDSWVKQITASQNPKVFKKGRVLMAAGEETPMNAQRQKQETLAAVAATKEAAKTGGLQPQKPEQLSGAAVKAQQAQKGVTAGREALVEQILEIFSVVTKYPKDMLEINMEMEADLGIDTVKQATIFSMIWEKFRLEREEGLQISNYTMISDVIDLVCSRVKPDSGFQEMMVVVQSELPQEAVMLGAVDEGKETLQQAVLEVVSLISKYPMDMLEPAMEMEADLGIDTVKQATIIARLSENYGIQREEWSKVSEMTRIQGIIDQLWSILKNRQTNIEMIAAASAAVENAASVAEKVLDEKKDMGAAILEIVSQMTSYPVEMLEPEMELEADLGINALRMKQILAELAAKTGIVCFREKDVHDFNNIRSLVQIADDASKIEPSPSGITGLSWQKPVRIEKELESADYEIADKSIWVIGDDADYLEDFKAALTHFASKINTMALDPEWTDGQWDKAAERVAANGAEVIIDCTAKGKDQDYAAVASKVRGRFNFYKNLYEKTSEDSLRIVCTVYIDGGMGCNAKEENPCMDPYAGAIAGFYKGLKKEWTKSVIKIVDLFEVKQAESSVGLVCDEIRESGSDYEIGYWKGKRGVIRIEHIDKAHCNAVDLPQNPHFLITGGAQGIAGEITKALTKSYRGNFTLIGRTTLPEDIEALTALNEQQLAGKLQEIKEDMKAKDSKTTPVQIQTEYEKLIKAVEVYRTLKELEATGNQVKYFACDARNEKALELAINKAKQQNGPIHVLIHGAGIEKSHMIEKKSQKEFDAVFSTKVQSSYNLIRLCKSDALKAVIAFSSISGRFGNEAQLDYCAANSFLNLWIRQLKTEQPKLHALSLQWSGWKDVGMAWRNDFVRENAAAFGINLIEPKEGVKAFLEVLGTDPGSQEILLTKGLKNLIDQRLFMDHLEDTPLFEWAELEDKRITKAYKVFSVNRDGLISQHRLGSTPILPAVGIMELCTEYYRLQEGRKDCYCLRNLRFTNPFKLFREEPRSLYATGEPQDNGWHISIHSYFAPRNGQEPVLVTHGNMVVSDQLGDYSDMDPKLWSWIHSADFTLDSKANLFDLLVNKAGSQVIRFGGLYWRNADCEDLADKDVCFYNDKGVIFPVLFPVEQLNNPYYPLDKLLINPCFIDSMYQGAATNCLTKAQRVFLPWSVEEFGIVKVPKADGFFKVYAELVESDQEYRTYRITAVDENGDICCYARNAAFRLINQ